MSKRKPIYIFYTVAESFSHLKMVALETLTIFGFDVLEYELY